MHKESPLKWQLWFDDKGIQRIWTGEKAYDRGPTVMFHFRQGPDFHIDISIYALNASPPFDRWIAVEDFIKERDHLEVINAIEGMSFNPIWKQIGSGGWEL